MLNDNEALRTRAERAEGGLREAIDLAKEGWGYASEYFRDKWDSAGRIAKLKAALPSQPGEENRHDS